MSFNPNSLRSTLGLLGNLTSFLLFASPIPTIHHIHTNKSIQNFKFHPYIAGLINCAMWVFYSMPFIHPNNLLVTTVNATGFFLYTTYIIIYFIYSDPINRRSITVYLAVEAGFFAGLAGITLFLFTTHSARSGFVGIFCDLFGVILYSSPMTVMWMVVRTKSVEFMPLGLSLTGFLNGIVWSGYALIGFDPFILTNDGIGVLFGGIQLGLYACYYRSTPKRADEDTISSRLLSV